MSIESFSDISVYVAKNRQGGCSCQGLHIHTVIILSVLFSL